MTSERWQQIRDVLCDAVELAPEQRSAFLDRVCATDAGLRVEVESLLSSFGRLPSNFMQCPPIRPSTLVPGTKLGSYEILGLLGAGGMGEVYRAHHSKLRRDVALKVLPRKTAKDRQRLIRFQREARVVAAFNHPHIVTIYSVEEGGGVHFITMELVEGAPLSQLIPHGGLPLKQVLEISVAIADALTAAHEKEIVHRDLKPANIMVGKKGGVKVLDFGLAKTVSASWNDDEDADSSIGAKTLDRVQEAQTQTEGVMGTLPYMSPEQLQGKRLGPRSDLFSFGTVLYEMTTGHPPFSGQTTTEYVSSIARNSPTPITEIRNDIPLGLQTIMDSCLAKDERYRCSSARHVLGALEELRREFVGRQSPVVGGRMEDSIAVLPFTNMSTDPENEFLADGITEEIINALAKIEHLHVAARTSAFSFKGKQVDLRIIGERLNVRSILTGSVRRSNGRLRITVQLQNVADSYQLWSERYDRAVKDVFAIQDEIARSIVNRLRVTLEGDRLGPLVKAGTKNFEAYQSYVKGRAFLSKRGSSIPRAMECFKQAVAKDSEYAQVWANLADCHTLLSFYGFVRPELAMPQSKDAAQRALTLDPSLPEAHTAMALTCLLFERDLPQAERQFLLALEMNSRYVQARIWYAFFYLQLAAGDVEEGIAQAKLALESDPLSSYANAGLGICYFNAGRYAEALQVLDRALELDPDSYLAGYFRHCALHLEGRLDEAVLQAQETLTMSGRHVATMAVLVAMFSDWDKRSEAEAMYTELSARARREYVPPSVLVTASHALGLHEVALGQIRQALAIKDPFRHLSFSKYYPYGARLRRDDRYRELLARLGFG